jgi:hypothetical protein
MRLSGSTRLIIFSFILAISTTLTLPYFAFGAARSLGGTGRFKAPQIHGPFGAAHSFGGSGRFGVPGIHQQHFFSHSFNRFGFNRFGFFGVGGGIVYEQPVIFIQQFQPAAAAQPSEPAENRIYVQPRWVDGGYGVEVLQPGYWTYPKQVRER